MPEIEELSLRVSLDDQASAQLAALRGQLDQMRGTSVSGATSAAPQIVAAITPVVQQLTAMATQLQQLPAQINTAMSATVQGLAQVQTQLTQVGTQIQQSTQAVAGVPGHVAQTAQGLSTAIRQASFFGSMLGSFAGNIGAELLKSLGQLGLNLVQRATDFKALGESMQDVQIHARGVGMSMTGYRGLQRQMEVGGMSAKEAQSAISRLSDMQLEAQMYGAQNTPTARKLLGNIRPEDTETIKYMSEYLEKMSHSTLPEKINLTNEALENIRKTMTERGLAGGVEAAQKEFLEAQGLDPASWAKVREGYRVRAEFDRQMDSPAREQMFRDRTKETERFEEESKWAAFYWKDIGESIAATVLHATGLDGAMAQLNTWLKDVLKDVETFERVFRATDSFEASLRALNPAWAPFGQQLDQAKEDFKTIGEEINKWNTYFEDLGKAARDQFVKPLQDALTALWDAIPQGLKDFLTAKTPLVPPDTWKVSPERQKEIEERLNNPGLHPRLSPLQQKEVEDRLNAGAQPAQPQQPAQPGTIPPEQRDPMTGLPYEDEAPVSGKPIIVPPQPSPQPIEGKPIIVPPQQPPPINVPPIEVKPLRPAPTPPREARSWFGEEGAGPENLDPSRFTKFPISKRVEDERPPGVREYRSIFDPPKIPGEIANPIAREAYKSPEGRAYAKQADEWHTSTGSPLDKLQAGAEKFFQQHGAWKPGQLIDPQARQPSKSGVSHFVEPPQESSFDNRFGVWPGMGADKLDQTSAKLDAAANQNVNISGAGKIQVDVRAPPGTSVDATGEGFFKSTEITRLTQMLPADMGPLPMTGVGAGQGVAGNGTVSA